nr:MAG TPA: hypothetical protein [Caudoviricetes sp.]
MPSSTNSNVAANTGNTNTGNTGNTGSKADKQVMDDKVKEAFEFAAKELGMKIKFEGVYVVIDSECPPGTEDQLKKAEEECKEAEEATGNS